MVQGLGDGDVRYRMKSICRLFADATAPIALLRAAQRQFLKLLDIAAAMERGESADAAVKSLRPPVFFKEQPILIRQAQRWRRALISKIFLAAEGKNNGGAAFCPRSRHALHQRFFIWAACC